MSVLAIALSGIGTVDAEFSAASSTVTAYCDVAGVIGDAAAARMDFVETGNTPDGFLDVGGCIFSGGTWACVYTMLRETGFTLQAGSTTDLPTSNGAADCGRSRAFPRSSNGPTLITSVELTDSIYGTDVGGIICTDKWEGGSRGTCGETDNGEVQVGFCNSYQGPPVSLQWAYTFAIMVAGPASQRGLCIPSQNPTGWTIGEVKVIFEVP